ncbi:hypothetical protein I5677_16955 [Mobilitalea sibirica]|uniref:Beta-lactamase n=1 Tax=Mobilitalea sibirica TaxID=1462919 RepID=A0A8J7HCZ9_9FIRM|nr:hypothetical protein [Mobilitalea sibirica]MBH1942581.1 hypothetical protein [Mobilitalea sibirica]
MYTRGADDMHSNVTGLLAFDRALMNQKLLDSDMTNYVFAMQEGYGCEWMQVNDKTYMHVGSTVGYESYNMIFKGEQGKNLYVIFLFPNKNNNSFMNNIFSNCIAFMRRQE